MDGSVPFVGKTLLVVEDEPLIALDVTTTFEDAGAKVIATKSLEEALRIAEDDGLAAAVIDHALVDGDTQELRQKLNGLGIPFILYSGFATKGEDGGVHVSKPAPADVLIETLLALFTGRGKSD